MKRIASLVMLAAIALAAGCAVVPYGPSVGVGLNIDSHHHHHHGYRGGHWRR